MGGVLRQLFSVLDRVLVLTFEPLEAGAVAGVGMPAGGPVPLGLFALLPGECPRVEGQPDGRAVRRHRGSWPGHEVVGVDDDGRGPSSIADGGLHLAQSLHADRVDGHRGEQGVVGRRDFLGAADEERVPRLGKEPPVGQDLIVLLIHRVLQEHVPVVRLAAQPGEQRGGRTKGPPARIGLAVVPQVAERLVKHGQVSAFGHRPEEGRRSRAGRAPQCEYPHERNILSVAGSLLAGGRPCRSVPGRRHVSRWCPCS